ncbi:MAG: 4a-hydroxytetrahydrobiopterin dehydratase [Nitriliruptoraceae bacterium]
MSLLAHDDVRAALEDLDGWEFDGDAIRRELRFDGFREAIAFINRVADLADEANHHPELTNVYATVTVVLTTHDAGGVTTKDLDLARAIDGVV